MVSYVVGKAKATNLRYLVDAYCGGGLFCLSASRDFEVRLGHVSGDFFRESHDTDHYPRIT